MELNKKLLDASHKALFDYLGLSEDETLLILTDEKLNNIGKTSSRSGRGFLSRSILCGNEISRDKWSRTSGSNFTVDEGC